MMITFGSHSLATSTYSKYNKNEVKYREANLGFPVLRLEYCSRFVKINTFSCQAGLSSCSFIMHGGHINRC